MTPKGWAQRPLGQLAQVAWGNTSLTKAAYVPDGYRAFSASGPDGFVVQFEHDGPGVVLSAIGARCGKCFWAEGQWTAIKNTITITAATGEDMGDLRFLFHYLNRDGVWPSNGGAQPFIGLGNARAVTLLTPPIGEQKKIAAILSSLDQAIHATQAVTDQLEAVKQAMMADLLTRGLPGRHKRFKQTEIGEVPESWGVAPLSAIAADTPNAIVDGPFGSNLKSEHYRPSGVPVIQSSFVTTGEWRVQDYVYVDHELFQAQRRSAVSPNDIVMAKIGANAGACARVPADHQVAILAGNSLKITPSTNVDGQFLLYALQHVRATGRLDLLRSTTAQPAISLRSLKQMLLPRPSFDEQHRIAQMLDSVVQRIQAEVSFEVQLRTLKVALMTVLFTGELRVKPIGEAA